jgi:hypothetical protein
MGRGKVQTLSRGIAMIFFLHYIIALVIESSGVRARDLP